MKNVLYAIFALSLLTACSSPVLKWIDTPKDESGGNESGDKEITAFSLGIPDESVIIGSEPDSNGETPIWVILPEGTVVNAITPTIEYVGKILNPLPGRSVDFRNPRPYMVTAEDGSTRAYLVNVHVKESSSKAILRFAIDLPSALVAEGSIDEEAGTIAILVPAETDRSSLSARIVHNGASLTDPNNGKYLSANVNFRGNFSSPTSWIVTDKEGNEKPYDVTVTKRESSEKEITAFSLGIPGESVIIGSESQVNGKYLILAFVPGATAEDLVDLTPALVYKGSSISPGEGTLDFSSPANPVIYTVTAEDRSFRAYEVRVIFNETGESSDPQITGFYFTDPLIEGIINENAGTIALTVPQGTSATQRPEIYYLGASISPKLGQAVDFTTPVEYTVTAEDGTTKKTYVVTVTKRESSEKEITAFSLGIPGESVIIGSEPQPGGRCLILAFVPDVTAADLVDLTPALVYTGSSISPGEGTPQDFSSPANPVIYTVTAADSSSRAYEVRVVFNEIGESSDKQITGFYFTDPLIEGVINESAGTIALTVPQGTSATQRPEIYYLGASVSPMLGQSVDFSNAGTTPVEYTVTAQNGSKKTYAVTVTVHKRKSSNKEITAFGFGIAGESAIIGSEPQPDGKYPILALVPDAIPADFANRTPDLVYRGSFISPGEGTPGDFSNPASPVVYTVTAEDSSSRDYVIRVVFKETGGSSDPQITGFYFADPLIEGVINESAKTIALTVPQGTNTIQRPEIYYLGASVSPIIGQSVDFSNAETTPVEYTVRAPGKIQTYKVSVSTVAVPTPPVISVKDSGNEKVDIGIDAGESGSGGGGEGGGGGNISDSGNYTVVVEMPIHIDSPVITINYPGAGNTVNIGEIDLSQTTNEYVNLDLENKYLNITNNDVFNYVPIKLINDNRVINDNDEYLYVLAVNPPSEEAAQPPVPTDPDYEAKQAAASIDGFYFANPVAVGTIGKTDGTEGAGTPTNPYRITVTVPYGTDRRNLAATICYTGKEIAGIPGANPLKAGARSFTDPVDYTVKSYSGSVAKTYRVTVTSAPNTAKDITAFGFTEGVNPVSIIIGGSPNTDGDYPILITIPDGEDPANLTPVITHTGSSIGGLGWSGGSGTQTAGVTDFSSGPVEYTVQDWVAPSAGSKTYAVTVRNEGVGGDAIEITGFYFKDPLAAGIINQNDNTIAVIVPSATNTASLVPTVYFKGMTINPGSDRANNFNGPVIYTVTGINGKTRAYTVTVTKTPSSSKDLTRFDFSSVVGSETVIGAVPDPDGSYPVSVLIPAGTNLSNLSPDIVYSGISIGPASGVPQNFNVPQTYTITAEDGSTKTYKVTTTPLSGDSNLITSLVFSNVPLSGGGTIRALGAIDQASHAITVTVPYTAAINSLAPTITYIGKSIAGPSGGDQTANPFTDVARDFGADRTYTVKNQSGEAQPYTVKVSKQSAATVTFTGNADRTVIDSNTFDQATGIITINAKTDTVGPPYEWYVDGIKQGVSAIEPVFTLNVGSGNFTPGRHEIMLSGKSPSNGLHYTGKVSFTVAGGSK
ncbi:MAG: DUF5018 domain-containing protein [Treponema sp.]|jgi:hypothetical protein|nr:DUF5018 domain-containing protein [Treponema sp.]